MRPLVIYHSPCMDGFTAAWAVWLKHPDWEFYPAVHQNAPPDVAGRAVYLVDFSYKRPVLERMALDAERILILDHHKSAEQDLAAPLPVNVSAIFDSNKSGARLAWEYFHFNERIPYLVKVVEDRDLWRFALPDSKPIAAVIFSYQYDFLKWNELRHDCDDFDRRLELVRQGEAIERRHQKEVWELVSKTRERMVIGDTEVWAANLPYTYSSDAGHLMSQGEPFAACYWREPEGVVFSLRSADDGIDVSEVAKRYGGGGHKHAAGFRLTCDEAAMRQALQQNSMTL